MRRAVLVRGGGGGPPTATGAVAWAAVHLAGEGTAEQAVRPLTARQIEDLATSTTVLVPPATTSSTSTTTALSTTTITTGPAEPFTTTTAPVSAARQTPGGTVVVSLQGGTLSLVSAAPAPGFSVEVKAAGPAEVVVVFEGEGRSEIRVVATAAGGAVTFWVEEGETETGGEG
jgi:hypothetical protein